MKPAIVFLLLATCWLSASNAESLDVAKGAREADLMPEDHIIRLDPHGNLKRVNGAQFASQDEENAYLQNITTKAFNHGKVLIFIHGGLNGKKAGEKRFNDDAEPLSKAGYYPIFIIWPSGILSTYGYHLVRLRPPERSGPIDKTLAVPLNLIADVGRAAVRAPIVSINLMKNDWTSTVAANLLKDGRVGDMLDQHCVVAANSKAGHIRLEKDAREYPEMTARFLLYCITLPGKFVTAPIIDAFGKSGWHEMNARLDRISARPQVGNGENKATAALARFFEILEKDDRSTNITLVGHSMGAILINKVLPDFKKPMKRVVFLAPACSIDEFDRGTLRYLESNPQVEFFNMTLHPAAESREIVWMTLDLAPRGSLLVWIDEFLDQPRTAGQRRLGKWENFYRVENDRKGIDNSVPFLERMTARSMQTRAYVRGFGVGNGEREHKISPWNSVSTKEPASMLTRFPQTHGEMGSSNYWTDEYLLNKPSPTRTASAQ
jgi:hypothetical protein